MNNRYLLIIVLFASFLCCNDSSNCKTVKNNHYIFKLEIYNGFCNSYFKVLFVNINSEKYKCIYPNINNKRLYFINRLPFCNKYDSLSTSLSNSELDSLYFLANKFISSFTLNNIDTIIDGRVVEIDKTLDGSSANV
jgi:hypothetical protein